eukprot:9034417-Alexandrium_andersonii.AAC.1
MSDSRGPAQGPSETKVGQSSGRRLPTHHQQAAGAPLYEKRWVDIASGCKRLGLLQPAGPRPCRRH